MNISFDYSAQMTLDQLRIFIAVAEREHLTRAADALHLTPSAVSAAIHALESRYGVRLFHRIGRRIELSQTGRLFLAEARATQQSARLAELALTELGGLQRGTLTIQASQTIASYWLPPFLVGFKAAHPAIGVVLREGNSADVAAAVLDGTADLGFAEGAIDAPALALAAVARDRLVVVAEGQFVCEHPRIIERNHQGSGRTVYDWRHYLAVLQRKPGALRNGAPFAELPDAFKRLQALLLKQPGGDREMVEVLALVLQHDEQAVLAAVELALEDGAPRKTHIINVLHRLIDGTPEPEPIHSPQALALIVEPQANVVRYDQLRQVRHAS